MLTMQICQQTLESGQVSHLEKINKMPQQANAHFVQVFKQLIKDWYKVSARQLLAKYNSKMMN